MPLSVPEMEYMLLVGGGEAASLFENVLLVELMYLIFTRMTGKGYCGRFMDVADEAFAQPKIFALKKKKKEMKGEKRTKERKR